MNTLDKIDEWFDYSLNREKRILYFSDVNFDSEGKGVGIDSLTAEFFIKGLNTLNEINSKERIKVMMNSEGGDVLSGWAIYDSILGSEAPVDIAVYGQACSMAAVILQAADRRLACPNATIMVHDGYVDWRGAPMRSSEAWAKWSKEDRTKTYRIFAKRTGQDYGYWKEKFAHDYVMSANRALVEGVIDEVINIQPRWENKPRIRPKTKSRLRKVGR